MEQTNQQSRDGVDGRALDRLMAVLWIGVALSVAATAASNTKGLLAALGIGLLILLASFAIGCFLGFLFGVPRVLSREPAAAAGAAAKTVSDQPGALDVAPGPAPTTQPEPTSSAGTRLLQSNTNLERISDWLTTMLVGAGLVELHRINEALLSFGNFLAKSAKVFPDGAGQLNAGVLPAIGPIMLLFGVACGFLYMYLNTRLVLVRLFHAVEDVLAGNRLNRAEQLAVRAVINETGTLSSFIQQQYSTKATLTVDDALALMFDLLYKGDPDRVIELGGQLSATDARERAEYWFYLAAAFGQKLHRTQHGTPEWLSARDNALDCARRAVAINSLFRERLWRISEPQSSDNDLAPLREDPEFRRITGRQPE